MTAAASQAFELVTLSPALFQQEKKGILAVASDQPLEYWSEENFLADLPGKWELSVCAFGGSDVVGYSIMSLPEPGRAHIHHFMVAAPSRGLGVGSAMIRESLDRAQRAAVRQVSLKVHADSVDAQNFYRRHGFVELDRQLRSGQTYLFLGLSLPE
jgi:ribosomal protein S18 acetylase RimI-like enzyme